MIAFGDQRDMVYCAVCAKKVWLVPVVPGESCQLHTICGHVKMGHTSNEYVIISTKSRCNFCTESKRKV
jgi:hypothetical protein